ncbi:hypothetical protein BMS3Abin11_01554 [bacterium BMS3Abin11]|nr:hypothetical protein BMS3Abin11_01554 [bacterium BMS3Abin11]
MDQKELTQTKEAIKPTQKDVPPMKYRIEEGGLAPFDEEANVQAIMKMKTACTGTDDPHLCTLLESGVVTLAYKSMNEPETAINGSLAMMHEISPNDGLEGMLAAQMVATHLMMMESAVQSMTKGQPNRVENYHINNASKMSRTFIAQMEALQKYRTKGQQTIRVQHVQVNDGGQAIVGNVQTGGGSGGNG